MTRTNPIAIAIPGKIPAKNKSLIDNPVNEAKIIAVKLGGIIGPRDPATD